MSKELKYYHSCLIAVHNFVGDLIKEIEAELFSEENEDKKPKPRNLNAERALEYGNGTWRKSTHLKKKSQKARAQQMLKDMQRA